MVAKKKTTVKKTTKKTARKTVAGKKTSKKTTGEATSKKATTKKAVTAKQPAAAAGVAATKPAPATTQQKTVADKPRNLGVTAESRYQPHPASGDAGMGIGMLAAGLAGAALVAYLGYSILFSDDARETAQATTDQPVAAVSSDGAASTPAATDSAPTFSWTPPEAGLFAGGASTGSSASTAEPTNSTMPHTSSIFADDMTGHASGSGNSGMSFGGASSGGVQSESGGDLYPGTNAFMPPPPPPPMYRSSNPWRTSGPGGALAIDGTEAEADASDIDPRVTGYAPIPGARPYPPAYFWAPYPPPGPGYYWGPRGPMPMPMPPPYYR